MNRPWMTILLILANVTVFFFELLAPHAASRAIVQAAGFIPAHLSGVGAEEGLPPLLTLLTSQFLHGGFFHLGGNMLFLWIFGNNVEDELGPGRFLFFYLLCGIVAGLTHYLSGPMSPVPTIGASGAISGVLGAYAILFPGARIYTLLVLVVYITVIPLPAIAWVGIWLLFQIAEGILQFGQDSGVAWFAHIGGLLGGLVLLFFFRKKKRAPSIRPFSGSWHRSSP